MSAYSLITLTCLRVMAVRSLVYTTTPASVTPTTLPSLAVAGAIGWHTASAQKRYIGLTFMSGAMSVCSCHLDAFLPLAVLKLRMCVEYSMHSSLADSGHPIALARYIAVSVSLRTLLVVPSTAVTYSWSSPAATRIATLVTACSLLRASASRPSSLAASTRKILTVCPSAASLSVTSRRKAAQSSVVCREPPIAHWNEVLLHAARKM